MQKGLVCKLKILTVSEHPLASKENKQLIAEMLKLQIRYLLFGNKWNINIK